MPQVTVMIDGKAYRMACDEGQEAHLSDLAERFDRYVGHLKSNFGEIGDQRLTVMAGLMIMDELTEVQKRLQAFEGEMDALRQARDEAVVKASKTETSLTDALSGLADRMENLAEQVTSNPS